MGADAQAAPLDLAIIRAQLRALWSTALTRAIVDAVKFRGAAGQSGWTSRRAQAWVDSDDEQLPSFRAVCGALDLDADTVRARIATMTLEEAVYLESARLTELRAAVRRNVRAR